MFKRTLLTAALLGVAAIGTPIAAQTNSVVVQHGDLDLTSEAGRTTLETRLNRAVRDVCGSRGSSRTLADWTGFRRCVTEARESYKEQVLVALKDANERRLAVLTRQRFSD
jgi:UrcA family protein